MSSSNMFVAFLATCFLPCVYFGSTGYDVTSTVATSLATLKEVVHHLHDVNFHMIDTCMLSQV